MAVIQALAQAVVERDAGNGRVNTTIGCVDTGQAEITVMVAGSEIDITITSSLASEGAAVAAVTALEEAKALAYISVDDEDAEGLIRLIRQAIEVRALGLTPPGDAPQEPHHVT